MFGKKLLLGALSASTVMLSASMSFADTVNIYSYRQPDLIAPLLDAFTKETGIKTEVQFLKKGMIEKLKAEGVNSPADVILTVDIGRLSGVAGAGLTQSLDNNTINTNIPENYRSSEGNWFGLNEYWNSGWLFVGIYFVLNLIWVVYFCFFEFSKDKKP